MSKIYIMYMTPTREEATRIGLMAKRIHREPLGRCVMISPMTEGKPIYREPQHGKPRIRCHWAVSTRNVELAMDTDAWDIAIELYDTKPYWLAYLMSWIERWKR